MQKYATPFRSLDRAERCRPYAGLARWIPHQFPIAYIPIRLEKTGDLFALKFDNRLFFNRRALKHVVDQNPEAGLRVPGPPTNDRIHFLFDSSPLGLLEDTVLTLTDS